MSSTEPRPRRSSAATAAGIQAAASARPEHSERETRLRELASRAVPRKALREDGVSLYVHLPFCVRKCRYCDFNSYAWSGQSLERHVRAVLAEARMRVSGLAPQTVFVGGGTPSYLPAPLLAEFLEELAQITGFRASATEVTMEANPESFDAETARAALDGGVNRISLGVQSLQADVLQAYDRVHDADQALEAIRLARETGFARLNVDLIYAFPGQDARLWEADLTAILELGPEHLSAYELAYEPGTALTRRRDAGRLEPAPQEEGRALFERTRDLCSELGFGQYEVSNFAREGEACRHNLAYWRSLEYEGIGAGAAGWRGGIRRKNLALPEEYEAAALGGKDPVQESERPEPAVALFDVFLMGLRLVAEGVDLRRARRTVGIEPLEAFDGALADLMREGLLELSADGHSVRAAPAGLLFLDSILLRLLPGRPV